MGQLSWTGTPKPATQKQFDFIKVLIAKHETSAIESQIVVARESAVAGTLTIAAASVLIDYLKAQPLKPVEVTEAQPEAAPSRDVSDQQVPEGIYLYNGHVHKVQSSQKGHRYTKHWDAEHAEWVYDGAALLRFIKAEHAITAQQAAEFGHTTGACVFCSRALTDERSIHVGYGPVCADKFGLPWGETGDDSKAAEAVVNPDSVNPDSVNPDSVGAGYPEEAA